MMEKILKSTDINHLHYLISEKEKWADMFKKSIDLFTLKGEEEKAVDSKQGYKQQIYEIELIRKRIDELKSSSNRIPSNFPVIDVPANGVPNWWEGAYTLCFVYSKYKGNFILRGWRGEVMEYLKKNYTHYFYNLSMWHSGRCRSHWSFWKNDVTIFEPSKAFKSWKYRVVKYSGSGMYERERMKELEFKRLPKRWIKKFDEL